MSTTESSADTRTVIVIILVFYYLLNTSVIGKPLLGSQEEESPNFQSNHRGRTYLMEGYDMFYKYLSFTTYNARILNNV